MASTLLSWLTILFRRRASLCATAYIPGGTVGLILPQGAAAQRPLAAGALSLYSLAHGADHTDRRVQPLPQGAGAARALAADDARPGALRPVLPDARVPFAHARRAARRRHRGGLRAAAAQADRVSPRQHHHPRSWRDRHGVLLLLRDRQPPARRKA